MLFLDVEDCSPFGVTLKGRNLKKTGLADEFRFGFQNTEKDDEVTGEGNSYTTEFRQYDPRLGRWLSLDPILKEHRSPYDGFNNNPIIFIDPRGDDDYYNSDGSYNRKMSKQFNNNGSHNIYVLSPDGKSKTLLADMPIKTESEKNVFEKVVSGYARKAGVSGKVRMGYISEEKKKNAEAYTLSKEVFVNNRTGVSDDLSDYHKLENVFYHEKLHQDDQKQDKNYPENTFEGLYRHAEIYTKQIEHSSFKRTTDDFKGGTIRGLAREMQVSLNKTIDGSFDPEGDRKKVLDLVDKFNSGSGKKYGYQMVVKASGMGETATYSVQAVKIKK